jgi:hypothetical protein
MREHGAVVTQALLIWLVTYVSFLAVVGFIVYVARGFGDRPWTNGAILRASSSLAFVGATVMWVLLILVD